MLLWFLGASVATVWWVFRDDRFDYRVLALGALAPDVIDLAVGGATMAHSVNLSIVVLTIVMIATRRGSPTRRRWLALPIGMFLHLVFDGVFNNTTLFWWPLAGVDLSGVEVPSLARMGWNPVLEAVGLVLLAVMWRTHSLSRPDVRRRFVRTGQLRGGTDTGVGTC